jgi:hypothetical protein
MQEAGRERNPNAGLEMLVQELVDPVGRRVRQQALEALAVRADRRKGSAGGGPTP